MSRNITYSLRSNEIILNFDNTVQFWSPYYGLNINILELVEADDESDSVVKKLAI